MAARALPAHQAGGAGDCGSGGALHAQVSGHVGRADAGGDAVLEHLGQLLPALAVLALGAVGQAGEVWGQLVQAPEPASVAPWAGWLCR